MGKGNMMILDKNLKLSVPANTDENVGKINNIYEQLYNQRRTSLIHVLRQIPSFVDSVRPLMAGKSYHVIIPQIGGHLGISKAGGFTPNIHGVDGGFIGQARLEEIPPDLSATLSQMSNQQAFAEILQRLEAIDQRIGDVLFGLHLDRISRVNAGINIYHQAILAKKENQLLLLNSAITELQKGLDFLLSELRNEIAYIDGLPKNFVNMLLSPRIPHTEVDKKIKPMQETYQSILRSAYFLPIAHEVMGNIQSQNLCLMQLKSVTEEFNGKLSGIIDWLTENDKLVLLETWQASYQIAGTITRPDRLIGSGQPQDIGIQFTPTEITSEE